MKRAAAVLFLAYWLVVLAMDVFRRQTAIQLHLHLLLPVIAGAMAGWRRRDSPGWMTAGMLAGGAVLAIDAAAVLTCELVTSKSGENGKILLEVPPLLIAIGVLGAVLGLLGGAGSRLAAWARRPSQ